MVIQSTRMNLRGTPETLICNKHCDNELLVPTLLISINVKAVSCSLDVSIDLINVFVENDQLDSYVNEKLSALV